MSPHEKLVNTHLKRNFSCILVDGVMAVAGFSALGLASIMPGMIHDVALRYPAIKPWENRIATALLVCFWGLSSITGFLFGGSDEHRTHRKRRFLIMAFVARLAFPLLAVSTFFMVPMGYPLFLVVFILSLAWWSLLNGSLMPQWFDYIGRLIPTKRRGVLLAGRDTLGTLVGIGIVAMFPWFSARLPFPYNYALMYTIGAVFLWASFVTWLPIREIPYTPEELRPRIPFSRRLRRTLAVFSEDRAFRRLILTMAVLALSTMAAISLFTLKAINQLELSNTEAARFTSLAGIVNISGYALALPLFGVLADRVGYKRIAYLVYPLRILCYVVAIAARNEAAFLVAIGLAGAGQGGGVLVHVNFPLEFVPENRRPTYMALKSLFNLPFIVMPFLGGWLADRFGYDLVFWIASGIVAVGIVLFGALIRDPRRESDVASAPPPLSPFQGRRPGAGLASTACCCSCEENRSEGSLPQS